MPIFEYYCKKCGHEFEALVRNADAEVECEKCAAKKVERKLSRFSASVANNDAACPSAPSCPGASRGSCGCGCGGHRH